MTGSGATGTRATRWVIRFTVALTVWFAILLASDWIVGTRRWSACYRSPTPAEVAEGITETRELIPPRLRALAWVGVWFLPLLAYGYWADAREREKETASTPSPADG